jgi:hypothetical protein
MNVEDERDFLKVLFLYHQKNFRNVLTGEDLFSLFNTMEANVSLDYSMLMAKQISENESGNVTYNEFEVLMKQLL